MADTEAQVAELRAAIAQQEREIGALERELVDLRAGVAKFEARYNKIVKPVADRVQAAQAAFRQLQELQLKRAMGELQSLESLWRKNQPPPAPNPMPAPDDMLPSAERTAPATNRLKTLYRKLARLYHPDTAGDEAGRAARTQLMALINQAYSENDYEALADLAKNAEKNGRVNSNLSLAVLQVRRLQQQADDLAMHLEHLKAEKMNLQHGILVNLQLQAALAKAKGQDLLREMADSLEQEYQQWIAKVDALRQELL
jgi:hypothetical protein